MNVCNTCDSAMRIPNALHPPQRLITMNAFVQRLAKQWIMKPSALAVSIQARVRAPLKTMKLPSPWAGWPPIKDSCYFIFLKCTTPSTPPKDTRGSSDLSPLQHQDMSNLAGVLQQIEKVELVRLRRRRNS